MNTSKKTNRAMHIIVEPGHISRQETPDWSTQCHDPIDRKIERDRSDLRAAGFDYHDFVDHLLELIAVLQETPNASSGITSKPESKIMATRLRGCPANVLKLKLRIE